MCIGRILNNQNLSKDKEKNVEISGLCLITVKWLMGGGGNFLLNNRPEQARNTSG